jgi:peroxin-6
MLQPGRFDVLIYLGISDDQDSRCKILKAQTRKMNLLCEIEDIEKIMPTGYTGADIFNYVSSAFKIAMIETKELIRSRASEGLEAEEELNRNHIRDYMMREK